MPADSYFILCISHIEYRISSVCPSCTSSQLTPQPTHAPAVRINSQQTALVPNLYPTSTTPARLFLAFLPTSHNSYHSFQALSDAPRQPGSVILSRLFCFVQPHRFSSQQPSARLGKEPSPASGKPNPPICSKHHTPPRWSGPLSLQLTSSME